MDDHASESRSGKVPPPLSVRFVHGGGWLAGTTVLERGLILVRIVVLSRLLRPEDFGVFAFASMGLALVEVLTQTGLLPAIMRFPGDVTPYLSPILGVQILRGLLCALFMMVFAWVGMGFGVYRPGQEVVDAAVAGSMALAAMLRSGINPAVTLHDRELNFRTRSLLSLSNAVIDAALAISVALVWPTPGALVLGAILGAATQCVASYALVAERPLPTFDFRGIKQFRVFGFWLWFAAVCSYISQSAERWLMSSLLGVGSLGAYTMAARVPEAALGAQGRLAGSLVYATFSAVNTNPERLRRVFLRALNATLYCLSPVALFLVIERVTITELLFGERWGEISLPLAYLSLANLARVVVAQFAYLGRAMNQAHLDAWLSLLRGVLVAVLSFWLMRSHGITGAALASLLGVVLTLPAWIFRGGTMLAGATWREWLPLSSAFVASMTGYVAVSQFAPTTNTPIVDLVSHGTILMVFYSLPGVVQWAWTGGGTLADMASLLKSRYTPQKATAGP